MTDAVSQSPDIEKGERSPNTKVGFKHALQAAGHLRSWGLDGSCCFNHVGAPGAIDQSRDLDPRQLVILIVPGEMRELPVPDLGMRG